MINKLSNNLKIKDVEDISKFHQEIPGYKYNVAVMFEEPFAEIDGEEGDYEDPRYEAMRTLFEGVARKAVLGDANVTDVVFDWRDEQELWVRYNVSIDDLTATNSSTPKEGAMATNNEVKFEYEVYEVKGVKCVDKQAAMAIIGLQYPTELRNYVLSGKVKHVGEVQVKGKTNKNVFDLETVLAAKEDHRTRGSDAPERIEITIHMDVLKAAAADIALGNVKSQHVITLLQALSKAKSLTAERRAYNQAKKA